MDAVMEHAAGDDNAVMDVGDPYADEPTSPPPREWAAASLPGDDLTDVLTDSSLTSWSGDRWRVVPHRSSRKELPMLGFPSPDEHKTWYDDDVSALEAARQLAVHLRDRRVEDMERQCGPALFVAVCGPFANKKLASRAVMAARAIDRSIRYEVSCVVANAKTREPHVVVRTPMQGSFESFASRFPGGQVPWQQIADDIARRNGEGGTELTLSHHGLIEAGPSSEPANHSPNRGISSGVAEQPSAARGNVRIQLGRAGGSHGTRGGHAPSPLRTVTDASAEDAEHKKRRNAGRRILVEGRVAAASASSGR